MTILSKIRLYLGLAATVLCLCALPAFATPKTGEPAPAFTLPGADGATHSLSDYKGKIVVLEWTNPECPYVKKHYGAGAMQKTQRDLIEQGDVAWLRISSSAEGREGYLDEKAAKELAAHDNSAQTAFLLDADGTVGHLYGATTTPDMVVIDKDGTVRYTGAIDDAPSADPATLANAKNYVTAAVTALRDGKAPEPAITQSYGCSVKYK